MTEQYDYAITVEPYGGLFSRWYWCVELSYSEASGFAYTEERAIMKAEKCAQRIIKQRKKKSERRTIRVKHYERS